jgi:aminomethyltransferase
MNYAKYLISIFLTLFEKYLRMKFTALTQMHEEAGARMVEYAGFKMPVEYTGIIDEHNAVRNCAGLFDASHMGEFIVKGKDALRFLQYVTTNDVSKLAEGQAQYSCFPNGKGGIVDDLIIYRMGDERYMLVVNASNTKKDWEWLLKNNTMEARLEDISDKTSLIALQGPRANDILKSITTTDLESIGSFCFVITSVKSVPNVLISATGYTGAGGYELYCDNENVPELWSSLIEAGKKFGLKPAGLAARDTLRLEMGYCLYGNDINDSTSPMEAGLGWIVKLAEKKNFIDRSLYEKQKSDGVSRKLVGFELLDRGIPRKDYVLQNKQGEEIGIVTSGTMSPSLQKGIGMGYVQSDAAFENNEIFVQIRNKLLNAKIVKLPFYKS